MPPSPGEGDTNVLMLDDIEAKVQDVERSRMVSQWDVGIGKDSREVVRAIEGVVVLPAKVTKLGLEATV